MPSVTLSGEGEHLYLDVEKTNVTTTIVQRWLAEHYGVPPMDVSYAGLKDKRAVARQWFSVRLPGRVAPAGPMPAFEGVRVLGARRHHKKLRPGDLRGNHFEIVVRNLDDTGSGSVAASIDHLRSHAFPNYFGPQRFGRGGGNVDGAAAWVQDKRPRIPRLQRSMYISTMRSLLFNAVLEERVARDTWQKVGEGDVAAGDCPTGPLWGRGRLASSGEVRSLEEEVTSRYPDFRDALEWVGLGQDRRPLAVTARGVDCDVGDATVRLSFELPKGSYATVALAEVFELTEAVR